MNLTNSGDGVISNSNTGYADPTAIPTIAPASQPVITSDLLTPNAPINYQTPKDTPAYPVAGLDATPPMQPTAPEVQANDLTSRLQALNDQLTGQSAFRAQQEDKQGMTDLLKTQTDLTSQLKAIQNEAQAIPLQMQQDATGRGMTAGGLAPLQTARLRANAIQALSISSLLEASRGNLATAQTLVDRAVAQRFDPIKEEIAAKTANLDLILKSPAYSLADKNRAQSQMDIQDEKAKDVAKQEQDIKDIYEIATNVAQYGADALTLQKISQAKTPVEALEIASSFNTQRQLQADGYIKITGPSQLARLKPNDIIRVKNSVTGVEDIYKKPQPKLTVKDITVGTGKTAKKYLITYDELGNEMKRELLGGDNSSGTNSDSSGGFDEKQAIESMKLQLKKVKGLDGFISPRDYTIARNAWIDAGGLATTFDTKFKGYRNPNNPYYVTEKTPTKKSSSSSGQSTSGVSDSLNFDNL